MSRGEDASNSATASESIRVYNISMTPATGHNIPLVPTNCIDRPPIENSNLAYTGDPQAVEDSNDPSPNGNSTEDAAIAQNEEATTQVPNEQLKELASEEKKLVITMEDLNERKLSFPYSLVKTWDVSLKVVK